MSACKAIVRDGPRKGQPCIPVTDVDSDGYCMKHQRQKQYDILMAQGKHVCRMFFRGCNSEIQEGQKTCQICLKKKIKSQCAHQTAEGKQCPNKILNDTTKYCGKHQRDTYREFEREKNVKLCNIERGCMNVCEDGFESCVSCILNNYIANDRYYSENIDNKYRCIICEMPYESTFLHDTLKRCSICSNNFMVSCKDKKVIQQRSYRNIPLNIYYNTYVKGAYIRNKEIQFHLSLSEFIAIIKQPCFYCNTLNENDYMGIDRIDNKKDYSTGNCVSCCTTCNRMKHAYSINEFINKCYTIHTYLSENISLTNKLWSYFPSYKTMSTRYYSDYKRSSTAETGRNLEFCLEKDEFNTLRTNPCYLCGVENTDDHYNGIDRVDNSKGYIVSNCKTCCGHCNALKGPIPIGIVKYHISRIALNNNLYKYKCCIDLNDTIPVLPTTDLDIPELPESRFTTKELTEFFAKSIEDVVQYCKIHNRSDTFIRKVQKLYETQAEKTKDELHLTLLRYNNAENQKTITDKRNIKKHMKTNDVLTLLENNKLDEYLEWHNRNIGPETSLFRKTLEIFSKDLPSLSANEKISQCKDILKKEQYRRHYNRAIEKIKEKKEERNSDVPIKEPPIFNKPFITVSIPSTKPNIITHVKNDIVIPRQWKARNIYDFITNNQENYYKEFCESSNDLSKILTWSTIWSSFVSRIKGVSWIIAEPIIREFIEELRRIRHLVLCQQKHDILDREDRQVWPAESIAKLFLEGRILEYKHVTEEYTGDKQDDPKWIKRWEQFVGNLEKNRMNTTELVNTIRIFMTAQRTKSYRRSKQSVSS